MNVEIELDGRKYAGKYRLERSTVIVTSDYGTTVGKKSHLPSKVVAEALLL